MATVKPAKVKKSYGIRVFVTQCETNTWHQIRTVAHTNNFWPIIAVEKRAALTLSGTEDPWGKWEHSLQKYGDYSLSLNTMSTETLNLSSFSQGSWRIKNWHDTQMLISLSLLIRRTSFSFEVPFCGCVKKLGCGLSIFPANVTRRLKHF